MSGAILLMILNIIGLGGGPTLVGTLSTNYATANVAAGMDAAAASAAGLAVGHGLDDAILRRGRHLSPA